jgi:hypothetical protein
MRQLDWAPVLKGALLAGVIALAFGIGGRALPSGSSLVFLFALIIFAGMGVGGFVAGQPQPRVALTAGAVAAGLAAIVIQVINVVVAIARGTLTVGGIATVVLTVLICTSAGSLGGYAAFRRTSGDELRR